MPKWIHLQKTGSGQNWHGPNFATLRRTWKIVRMGSYAKMWTLYVYRADGSYWGWSVTFPQWRGPWPDSAGPEPIRKGTNDAK